MNEMPFIAHIDDDIYPKTEITFERNTSRGVLFYQNKIALMHIVVIDKFGDRNHLETPGGGIEEGETPEQALIREMQEEVGCKIKSIKPIGKISNDYNLLNCRTIGHFFLADIESFCNTNYTEEEKGFFSGVEWLDVDSIVKYYEDTLNKDSKNAVKNCGIIIHTRDLMAIKLALQLH